MLIETEFDGLLEEDVIFEETDQSPGFVEIMKNSENLLKSFLYLKKMFNTTPLLNRILKVQTVEETQKSLITQHADTNVMMVKNVSDQNSELFINDGLLVLLPFESFEFPIDGTYKIEVSGKLSIVESQYKIG